MRAPLCCAQHVPGRVNANVRPHLHLDAGIAAVRAGNQQQARAHLLNALRQEPRNEAAWLWLSRSMPTIEQALRCIEHLLTLNPRHPQALEAKEVLNVRLLLEEATVLTHASEPAPSTPERRYKLGEALIEARVITQHQLEQALEEQARLARKNKPLRLGEVLLRMRLVRPEQLQGAIAAQVEHMSPSPRSGAMGLIGEYLVQRGLITHAQLHEGLAQQAAERGAGKPVQLGEMPVRLGYLGPGQLNQAILDWQEQYNHEYR